MSSASCRLAPASLRFMANALGPIAACRRRHSVLMVRADRMLKRLKAARLDQSHDHELRRLIRVDLLLIDDFCLHAMDHTETQDFYDIVVERHRRASTKTTSTRAPDEWLAAMADPSSPRARSTGLRVRPTSWSSRGSPTATAKDRRGEQQRHDGHQLSTLHDRAPGRGGPMLLRTGWSLTREKRQHSLREMMNSFRAFDLAQPVQYALSANRPV